MTDAMPLAGLASRLHAALPDLALDEFRPVDTGFGSFVVETIDGLILRIARTASAARGHEIEARVLPVLAPMLPVAIPVPVVRAAPTGTLPFGAIGYRSLPGQMCQPGTATVATARDVGTFLAALHDVDPMALPAMPGPALVWQNWHRLRTTAAPILSSRLSGGEYEQVERWWRDFLADERMCCYPYAVRHGDLWYGNLLIRGGGELTAVLDWENIAIADPSQDLAASRHLGTSFAAAVLEAYRSRTPHADAHLEHRIQRHWELRELTGIPLAAAAGDDCEIAECIVKLRAGPILS